MGTHNYVVVTNALRSPTSVVDRTPWDATCAAAYPPMHDVAGVNRPQPLIALAVLILCAGCAPTPTAAPSASPTGSGPTSLRCTAPNLTTRQIIERLFELSTSHDASAVADCYAQSKRTEAGFEDFAARWVAAGPASALAIRLLDRVNECDRFGVQAQLANGESVASFGRQTTFFSVGLEGNLPRIFDAGSALAAPEFTRVTCK